jgi:hypothetical protein
MDVKITLFSLMSHFLKNLFKFYEPGIHNFKIDIIQFTSNASKFLMRWPVYYEHLLINVQDFKHRSFHYKPGG